METPILIHVGLHKTASTWLREAVFKDPSFGFTRVWPRAAIEETFIDADPFDFDVARASEMVQPFLAQAAETGTVPVMSNELLSGHMILTRWDTRLIADRLRETFQNARVLIVIREQRSMMLSTYKQFIRTSGTLTIERLWGEHSPEEWRRNVAGLRAFEYHHLIGYYQKLFGKDGVLVLPYEVMESEPMTFLSQIYSFVERPVPDGITFGRTNFALPGLVVALLRYSNVVLRDLGLLYPFGGPIANKRVGEVRGRILQKLSRTMPPSLSRPFDRRLKAAVARLADGRFEESNQQTAAMTGIDLAALGYATARNEHAPAST